MIGAHDHLLVVLSVLVAAAASYTALDLAGRIQSALGRTRAIWLAAAAVAMGGGIWAMHFIAMLAFTLPVAMTYDPALTAASLLVAIAVTGFGFAVASRPNVGRVAILASGGLMGLGIAGMHYMGMAAMRIPANLSHDARFVVASVVIAIGSSTVALLIAFRNARAVNRAAAAAAMGLAIAGMHYTAMLGAVVTPLGALDHAQAPASIGQVQLAVGVAAATLLILLIALTAAMFDRRFSELAAREAAALRDSEEWFRRLYRDTPVPLHAASLDGIIEQVSDAWLDLLGYSREEVVGTPLTRYLAEASKLKWSATHAGDLKGRYEDEYFFRTRSGRTLDICVDERLVPDAHGRMVLLGGLRDMTRYKRAEAELRQAQKLESIGQLTGGLAHDFNNLLSVILGNAEMLARRVDDDAQAKRLVAGIEQAASRGAALTQRMLAFARKQDLKPVPVDVPNLVRGMADMLRRTLGPSIQVILHFPLELPKVMVDPHQLEMALLNVAVNARDAMPGGGTLTVTAGAVDGDGEGGRGFVQIAVTDTGHGMDAATLARAADPFFTTKGVGKGTGLGLSMVQGMAAQSGGRFTLESELGAGTTATIWLPVAAVQGHGAADTATDAAEGPHQLQAPRRPGPTTTVLVVDDDPLVLTSTAAMLDDLGYHVVEAASGPDALDHAARGGAVDILLTDFAMPKMNGLELIAGRTAGAAREACRLR